MRAAFLLSSILIFAPALLGEEEKVDFSEGLSRISALGLPDMKGAEWVNLSDQNETRFASSYELREMNFKLSGNTWKLKTDPPTYLDFGASELIDPPKDGEESEAEDSDAKPSFLEKMLKNHKEKNPEEEKAPKPEAPEDKISLAAKDSAKIATSLAKADVAEELNNSIEWGYTNTHGRLMLFAAQLHAAGETESANKLASALFLAASDDSALIDGAISHLADTEYNKIASLFFKNYDWKAYQQALTALLEKFPRGWGNGPAVAMLVSNLDKRSATPPKPSIPGVQIKPEALALLDKLLEKNVSNVSDEELAKSFGVDLSEYPAQHRARIIANLRAQGGNFRSQNHELWILKTPESPAPEANASASEKLQAMGMDGLIALAAIANDETLVPVPHASDQDSYFGRDESAVEVLQKRYKSLNRPASRGEIASAILAVVIPSQASDPYSRSEQPDPNELATNAIQFWKSNKDKSPVEIAILYITEGNEYQRPAACSFLATSKDPAAHAAFEKTVLASDNPVSLIAQVEQYISTRKTAAKTFANAYIKLLKENPPDEQELMRTNVGYQIREAGGLDSYLKRLSLKVGDVSLDKMIADALKAKPKQIENENTEDHPMGRGRSNTPIAALAPSIQSIPVNECLIAFGKAAKNTTPEQWFEIHQLLVERLSRGGRYTSEETPEEDTEKSPALSKEVIEIWKSQITRTEPIPKTSSNDYFTGYGAKTLGEASILLLEFSSSPETLYKLYYISQIEESSNAIMDFSKKRIAALTAGQEPEPWPNSENVSEDRHKEISDKITTLKAEEIIPFAKTLNRDERLALMEIIQTLAEEEKTPAGLVELRQTIVSTQPVFDRYHDSEAAAKLGIKVGDKITAEYLTKLSDDLLKDPAANSTMVVMFSNAPMYLGSSIYVMTAKDLDPSRLESTNLNYLSFAFKQHAEHEAIAFISIQSSTDMRVMKDGKPITLESDESAFADFAQALEHKGPTLPNIRISILTRADAEKISNLEEE